MKIMCSKKTLFLFFGKNKKLFPYESHNIMKTMKLKVLTKLNHRNFDYNLFTYLHTCYRELRKYLQFWKSSHYPRQLQSRTKLSLETALSVKKQKQIINKKVTRINRTVQAGESKMTHGNLTAFWSWALRRVPGRKR